MESSSSSISKYHPHYLDHPLGKMGQREVKYKMLDSIKSTLRSGWMIKAESRPIWKGLVKTYAYKWVVEGVEINVNLLT